MVREHRSVEQTYNGENKITISIEPWQWADYNGSWFYTICATREKYMSKPVTKPVNTELPVAIKHDGLKPRFDLLPWDALAELDKVYQFGAEKYDARNWEKGFDWLRLWNAAMRHMTAWETGESIDPETNLSHMVHAAFCILGLITQEIRQIGTDDRHRPVTKREDVTSQPEK